MKHFLLSVIAIVFLALSAFGQLKNKNQSGNGVYRSSAQRIANLEQHRDYLMRKISELQTALELSHKANEALKIDLNKAYEDNRLMLTTGIAKKEEAPPSSFALVAELDKLAAMPQNIETNESQASKQGVLAQRIAWYADSLQLRGYKYQVELHYNYPQACIDCTDERKQGKPHFKVLELFERFEKARIFQKALIAQGIKEIYIVAIKNNVRQFALPYSKN